MIWLKTETFITPRLCSKPWFNNIPGDRAFTLDLGLSISHLQHITSVQDRSISDLDFLKKIFYFYDLNDQSAPTTPMRLQLLLVRLNPNHLLRPESESSGVARSRSKSSRIVQGHSATSGIAWSRSELFGVVRSQSELSGDGVIWSQQSLSTVRCNVLRLKTPISTNSARLRATMDKYDDSTRLWTIPNDYG